METTKQSAFSLADFRDNYRNCLKRDLRDFESSYKSAALNLLGKIQESNFWNTLLDNLQTWNYQYEQKNKVELFKDKPTLVHKPFKSFEEKIYRKCRDCTKRKLDCMKTCKLVTNENFPINFFGVFDDVIRTQIIVKYIDGVELLRNHVLDLKNSIDRIKIDSRYVSNKQGYYALHMYIKEKYPVLNQNYGTSIQKIQYEIQMTTEMKILVKNELHKYYESDRICIDDKKDSEFWAGAFDNYEFKLRHIGHMVHFIEVLLVEIRDKKGETNEQTK